MENAINNIFAHLKSLERPISDRQRPGLDSAAVADRMHECALEAPSDLTRLYGYCDGTETFAGEAVDRILVMPGFYWLKLDDAIAIYNAVSNDENWRKSWLPILANGGGDFYAVVCDRDSPDFGAVVGFILGENDHLVEFKDLAAMFNTVERSYSEGAFYVADGYLEADYPKMRAIVRSIQPNFVEHEA